MTQIVILRVFSMPCCHHQICWVNPRLPTFCPECGARVFDKVREGILFTDDHAILKCKDLDFKPWDK